MNRRAFLATSALLGAEYVSGCHSESKSWKPSFPSSYFRDRSSTLRIIYLPDMHDSVYQNPAIEVVKQVTSKEKIDLIAVEAMWGVIDQNAMEQLKQIQEHYKHREAFDSRVNADLQSLEQTIDRTDTSTSIEKLEKLLKKQKLLRMTLITLTIQPRLNCCPVDYVTSPYANPYAFAFFDHIPVFGYDDKDLLSNDRKVRRLDNQSNLYSLWQESQDGLKQIIEKHFPIKEYEQASQQLRNEYGISNNDDLVKFTKNNFKQRSIRAVENVTKQQHEGTVLLIMGKLHEEDIKTECEKRSISLAIPELPTLMNELLQWKP